MEYHILGTPPSAIYPIPISTLDAETPGYNVIFVPALLVVNAGAPPPFVLKSILLEVPPFRYICEAPVVGDPVPVNDNVGLLNCSAGSP
jgi:hypothetical protein